MKRLLGWLDGGVESNGESYVEMRRRLRAYFDRRNCDAPDDLADETLNRVSRRLEEEGTLTGGPPGRYCYIMAKFVFLEHVRRMRRELAGGQTGDVDLERRAVAAPAADEPTLRQKHLSCLDGCLEELPPRDRALILDYYVRDHERAAERRRGLAARLGLTSNALAIRACRIRAGLEECVRGCAAER